MKHEAIQSKHTTTNTVVKSSLTLARAKEIAALTHDYFLAIKKDLPLPSQPLPELHVMLKANKAVQLFLHQSNFGLSIRLFNTALTEAQVVSVWQIATESTQHLAIGNTQIFIVKNC